jgi:hypothetical protein
MIWNFDLGREWRRKDRVMQGREEMSYDSKLIAAKGGSANSRAAGR